jgi:hypothetical protein
MSTPEFPHDPDLQAALERSRALAASVAARPINHIDSARLLELARAALLAEYDTQEHDDAFNAFSAAAVVALQAAGPDLPSEWDSRCLKATWQECIDEALKLLGLCLQLP